jgi:hypothetical protein
MVADALALGLGLVLQFSAPLPTSEAPASEPCVFVEPGAVFDVPRDWKRHRVPELRMRLSTPPGWRSKARNAGWEWVAPGGQARLRVRRHPGVGTEDLVRLQRHVEAWRLGAPVPSEDCATAAQELLSALTGWKQLRFGVYRRPLGERRQNFALFVDTEGEGLMEVLLTVYWRPPEEEPPMALVRAIFASVRPKR